MKKYVLLLSALLALLILTGGCDSLQFSALNSTETPTRTPRATFTPRALTKATKPATAAAVAAGTDTPETASTDTPEAAATDTPEEVATDTPVPPTKPKVTRIPPTAAPPPAPTTPPLPVYPDPGMSYLGGQAAYPCYQEGNFYEVIVVAKFSGKAGKRKFAPNYTFGAFNGGTLLNNAAGKPLVAVTDDGSQSSNGYGYNCWHSSSNTDLDRYNGKLDVTDAVRQGTKNLTIRFINSASNLTPQSPDIPIQFPQAGRWFIYLGVNR